jgi:hypothetical protein
MRGAFVSTKIFFLTEINSCETQKFDFFEFEIAITLKLVRLSGRVNFTCAFHNASVIIDGL